ncbi:MAG: diguanylate cyclase [Planctomycetota bacterium]
MSSQLSEKTSGEQKKSQPLNVLVVDDDPAALRLIARIVSSAGHHVRQAENGRLARDAVLREPPDLVVCDWDMPELDGIQLCRRIREESRVQYVYFLLLTGKSGTDDLVEGLAAGADDFVSKPINRAVLLARIEAGCRVLRMERKLRTGSQYDSLTGVLNRRAFHDRFDQEWRRAIRYDFPISCAMIDLDFFKRINDTHGHAAGDETLATIAACLKEYSRTTDIICRYGGEEFLVLLPQTDEVSAVQWAERARAAISEVAIPVDDLGLRVTASLGIAERLDDTDSPEQLIDLADQALAVAKHAGRNRVIRFGSLNDPMLDSNDKQALAGPLDAVVARDVMSVAVLCPSQDDTVRQVADLFLQLRLGSAPVIDEAGMVVGMVTDIELLTRTAFAEGWDDKIQEVMGTDVVCYDEETPLEEVYQFLSRVSVPRVVVTNRGRPTGVISRGTLLRWFRNWVATQKEIGAQRMGAPSVGRHERRRDGIMKTAEIAEQRAAHLRRCVETGEYKDLIPCVVGEATRLQSLVTDLLGHCQKVAGP